MKKYLKTITAVSLCLSAVLSAPRVLAENTLCSEINVGASVSSDSKTTFFTNASVESKGLAIIGAKATTDKYGETVYIPNETNAYIAVDVKDRLIEEYDNLLVEVDYTDSDYDNQSWLSIKYKGTDGETKYTKPVGMKNSEGNIETASFKISGAVFDNSFSGYDFQVTSFINNELYFYTSEPAYIKNIRVYKSNTISPIDISTESENKGNIFYDDDVISFDVRFKNNAEYAADFKASYNVYKIEFDGSKSLFTSREANYSLEADGYKKEVLEFEVPMYALYSLDIVIDGTCNGETIETETQTRFSKCILNDKANKSFAVSGEGQYADLIKAAGIGNVRQGYNLPYEQGASYKPDRSLSVPITIAMNNGIDSTATILLSNGRSLPPESAYYDVYNCVSNFITDKNYVGKINKISIGNEPEAFVWLDDENLSNDAERYEKIGRRFGIIASAAAQAVKDSGLNIKLSAFETGLAHENAQEPSFTRENLTDFYTAALAAMTEKGTVEYFDAFTCHAYVGHNNAEDVYASDIEYIKNILNSYNYGGGTYEIWSTEGGYSAANIKYYENVLYGNEHEKANKIVKQYTVMKATDFDGMYGFYNFIDSGLSDSVTESRFGMLENASSYNDAPLAAKQTYLAVAAVNKLTEDAVSCEQVLNSGNAVGYLYNCGLRSVYCLWTTDGEETEVEIPFEGQNAAFYDIYGNKITADASGNSIKVNGDVVYAVVGTDIEKSQKTVNKSVLNIHGAIQSHKKDKKVSLIVLGEDADINSDVPTGIKFIEQLTTSEDGEFNFAAQVGESNGGFEAYVFSEDSDKPLKLSFFCKNNDYDIALRSGIFRIDTLSCGLFDETNSSVRLKCNTEESSNQPYTLVYGMYKGDTLVHTGIFEKETGSESKGLQTYNTSLEENAEYDKIKIFLWDSSEGMLPLIDVTTIE